MRATGFDRRALLVGAAIAWAAHAGPANAQRAFTDQQVAELKAELGRNEAQCLETGMNKGTDGKFNLIFSCRSSYWMSFNLAEIVGRIDLMEMIAASFRRAAGEEDIEEGDSAIYWALMNARLALLRSQRNAYDRWMERALTRIRNIDQLTGKVLIEYANHLEKTGRAGEAMSVWDRLGTWMKGEMDTRQRDLSPAAAMIAMALSQRAFLRSDFERSRFFLDVAVTAYEASWLAEHIKYKDDGWLAILTRRAALAMIARDLDAAQRDLDAAIVLARSRSAYDKTSLLMVLGSQLSLAQLRRDAPKMVELSREMRQIIIDSTHAEDTSRAMADIQLGKALMMTRRGVEARTYLRAGIAATLAELERQPVFGTAERQAILGLRETLQLQIFLDWALTVSQRQ